MSTMHIGYRTTNIIPANMDSDKIISSILEMVNEYNEYFVKGKNHLHEKKKV